MPARTHRTRPDYDHAIGHAWNRLASADCPHDRARYLLDVADLHHELAAAHSDTARWAAATAQLLDALVDVELIAAGSLTRRHAVDTEFETAAGPVLDQMAATADVTDRARLLQHLHRAVIGIVGDRAAEPLEGIPYAPGMTGWHENPARSARRWRRHLTSWRSRTATCTDHTR